MSKKVYIVLSFLGTALFLFGLIVLRDDSVKSISGACIGIGASLVSISLSNLLRYRYFRKHPDQLRESTIEFNDERNTMIRDKAKAKAADIIQWFIMGIAYISMLIDAPLWVTLVIVGVFSLKFILEFYLIGIYQKSL